MISNYSSSTLPYYFYSYSTRVVCSTTLLARYTISTKMLFSSIPSLCVRVYHGERRISMVVQLLDNPISRTRPTRRDSQERNKRRRGGKKQRSVLTKHETSNGSWIIHSRKNSIVHVRYQSSQVSPFSPLPSSRRILHRVRTRVHAKYFNTLRQPVVVPCCA